MINNLFVDLLVLLGCAIVFGLICIVLAITWSSIKIVAKAAKEVCPKCSPVKTVKTDTSDATQPVKNTDEKKPNTTE
jgi:hypothetical protein